MNFNVLFKQSNKDKIKNKNICLSNEKEEINSKEVNEDEGILFSEIKINKE